MTALEARIKELVAFARSKDGEDRTALFQNLVDLITQRQSQIKNPTRRQLIDVVEALIPHVDPAARQQTASRLSKLADPPLDLLLALAKDRTDLITPLLHFTPFDEDQLVALIEATGRDHHHEISTRSDLSANVWIALARAAPEAPEHRRTKAVDLWSDTLAGNNAPSNIAGDTSSKIKTDVDRAATGTASTGIPLAAPDHAPDPQPDNNSAAVQKITAEDSPQNNEIISETKNENVTPLRRHQYAKAETRTPARLRILRMDEDLIAERIDPHLEDSRIFSVAGRRAGAGAVVSHAYRAPSVGDPEFGTHLKSPIADPGPGGWAWRSDRDGFVTAVSQQAGPVLKRTTSQLVGEAMLDLLGLNTKLGHPVARALQRRSTIHDAPLYLPHLEKRNRYWTLEATPLFNPQTGIFEGYEGHLTPVTTETLHEDTLPEQQEDDLFLPETGPSEHREPASHTVIPHPRRSKLDISEFGITETGLSGQERHIQDQRAGFTASLETDGSPQESHPQENQLEEAGLPSEQPGDHPASAAHEALTNNITGNILDMSPLTNMVSDTTRDIVRDLIDQAFEPIAAGLDSRQKTPPAGSEGPDPEVVETLQALKKALDGLVSASRGKGLVSLQIQAEMARACLRVLEDQIHKDTDPTLS